MTKGSGINKEAIAWVIAVIVLYMGGSGIVASYPVWKALLSNVDAAQHRLDHVDSILSEYRATAKNAKSKDLSNPLVTETIDILLNLQKRAGVKGIKLSVTVEGGGKDVDFKDAIEEAPGTKEYYRIPIRIRITKWNTSKGLMAFIRYHVEEKQVLITELNFNRGIIDFKGFVYGTYGEAT